MPLVAAAAPSELWFGLLLPEKVIRPSRDGLVAMGAKHGNGPSIAVSCRQRQREGERERGTDMQVISVDRQRIDSNNLRLEEGKANQSQHDS